VKPYFDPETIISNEQQYKDLPSVMMLKLGGRGQGGGEKRGPAENNADRAGWGEKLMK
jgi:hypothetical protein